MRPTGFVSRLFVGFAAAAFNAAAIGAVGVEVSGLTDDLQANVLAYLELATRGEEELSDSVVRRMFVESEEQIRDALRPFGYYEPVVDADLAETTDGWTASFAVEPGAPVILELADVRVLGEGSTDPEFVALLDDPGLVIGEPASHPGYDRLKAELTRIAAERGYFEAEFTRHELRVDPSRRLASAHLYIDTGPRYRLGEIRVEQGFLDEDVVARAIHLEEGDYYDLASLRETEYTLYTMGYFSIVDVEAVPDPSRKEVPLVFRPSPTRKHRWTVGGGYSTDTRVEVNGGWQNRYFNRRGHSMGFNVRLSEVKQDALYRYLIPYADPSERLTLLAGLVREERGDTVSSRVELAATDTRFWGNWQRDIFGLVQGEQSEITDLTFDDLMLIPGLRVIRTAWNDVTRPTEGYKLVAEVRGSSDRLGASTDFAQLRARSAFYVPMSPRWRFYLRGEIGLTAVDEFAVLPVSQRFFAGGTRSVRGFGFNELSPVDEEGNLVGGRYLVFASAELEWDILERWTLALFADGGNALDDFSDPIEYSAGVGFRWRSPIGLIGADVAVPFSTEDQEPRLHFTVRPEL